MRSLVREVIQEFFETQKSHTEPAHKAELGEERKRREQLERRVNELVEESKRNRLRAEEAERSAAIRAELQGLGVTKIDLAFRAVKDDIQRGEDGRLVVKGEGGETSLREHIARFVAENPELLPARIPGGSGTNAGQRSHAAAGPTPDLDKIRPGMDPEEMERVRQEIARVALQTMRGGLQ
ncbi:MAG: hypothetical protein ACRD44_16500 [Bryobacteraceae bacterium]